MTTVHWFLRQNNYDGCIHEIESCLQGLVITNINYSFEQKLVIIIRFNIQLKSSSNLMKMESISWKFAYDMLSKASKANNCAADEERYIQCGLEQLDITETSTESKFF